MQHKKQVLSLVTALGFGLSLGWLLPAQETAPAKQPQVKDRAEYDIYVEYTKGKDAKAKITILDKWKAAYPTSEFKDLWEDEYLINFIQSGQNRKAFDKAKELRGKNPNHFLATTQILQLIYGLGTPPQADDMATAEATARHVLDNLDTFMAPANKPAGYQDAQWTSIKPNVQQAAQRAVAWIWVQRKDNARAETELTKYLQMDGTQAQFSSFLGAAQLGQAKESPQKGETSLYHYARSAVYEGPNALPPAERQKMLTFVKNTYSSYHGSEDGLDPILARAKTNVFPPADFDIRSKTELAADEIAKDEEWKKAHPDLALWRDTVKNQLAGPDGAAYFESNIKGFGLPGGVNGVEAFKGTIISMDPATRPKQLVVAVFDPAVADATLEFEEALPGDMPVNSVIEFNGTGKAFTADPFMVTFEVLKEDLKGWTGVDAKGKTKGKAPPKGKAGKASSGKVAK